MNKSNPLDFDSCSYAQLLELNNTLEKQIFDGRVAISVFSNITVNQLAEPLQCRLRIAGLDSAIHFGNHDNIVQESFSEEQAQIVIVFWEAFNFTNNLSDRIAYWNDEQLNDLETRIKAEISIVLTNLSSKSLIIFNSFHTTTFNFPDQLKYKSFIGDLNQYLYGFRLPNTYIIDVSEIFIEKGIDQLVDNKFFYSFLAPYKIDFFKYYSNKIAPVILANCGKRKKAIIFDCDNTLWGGILGEDGLDNIKISKDTPEGKVFHDVQSMARQLSERGVIVGLCSKNNDYDVKEAFANHPHQVLRQEHIAIAKCNWQDKVTNLKEIARELNIGIDSIIFVDDSAFEINMVKEQLPEVEVIHVPENIFDFPPMFAKRLTPFFNLSITKEDKSKAQAYQEQSKREQIKASFENIDDYLKALDIEISLKLNDEQSLARYSQLTQKTNQFNLRTVRYTEQDIRNLLLSETHDLFSISVRDKFGESGITGLCILKYDTHAAFIDTFLLSCRIIGRKIEFKMMNSIIEYLIQQNVQFLHAEYKRTAKNELAQNFLENCGFVAIGISDSVKRYNMELNRWEKKDVPFIALESSLTAVTNDQQQ